MAYCMLGATRGDTECIILYTGLLPECVTASRAYLDLHLQLLGASLNLFHGLSAQLSVPQPGVSNPSSLSPSQYFSVYILHISPLSGHIDLCLEPGNRVLTHLSAGALFRPQTPWKSGLYISLKPWNKVPLSYTYPAIRTRTWMVHLHPVVGRMAEQRTAAPDQKIRRSHLLPSTALTSNLLQHPSPPYCPCVPEC